MVIQDAAGVNPPDAGLDGVEEDLGVVHQSFLIKIVDHVGDEHHLRQAEHVHELPEVVILILTVRLIEDVLGDVAATLKQFGHFIIFQLPQSCWPLFQ